MAVYEMAIKLGSCFTSIYLNGEGIALHEPSVVSFVDSVKPKNLIASGYKAKLQQGKSPDTIKIVSPVREGVIDDADACIIMLKSFIKRIISQSFIMPKIRALVCIPCGLTILERKTFEDVCYQSGISQVVLVESIICAGYGVDMPINSANAGFIVDIGGGTTEIAALSLSGIINGCTINIGGLNMDSAICDVIEEKHQLKIGMQTAEKLKEEIGSFYVNDTATMEVSGFETIQKMPQSSVVSSRDVLNAVLPYYHKIMDSIESIINVCQPEVVANIYKTGITLTGGGSQILGLEQLISSRLKIQANIPTDAKYAVILGAGKLINDKETLRSIQSQN